MSSEGCFTIPVTSLQTRSEPHGSLKNRCYSAMAGFGLIAYLTEPPVLKYIPRDWTFWTAATCRRFSRERRVAPTQSGLVRPHSKGKTSPSANEACHFRWVINEAFT
jgi:hypothetical protein